MMLAQFYIAVYDPYIMECLQCCTKIDDQVEQIFRMGSGDDATMLSTEGPYKGITKWTNLDSTTLPRILAKVPSGNAALPISCSITACLGVRPWREYVDANI